jgi:hypothetical protein
MSPVGMGRGGMGRGGMGRGGMGAGGMGPVGKGPGVHARLRSKPLGAARVARK